MAIRNTERQPNILTLPGPRMGCGGRQKVAPARSYFEIEDEILARLREDVMTRRVKRGLSWLEENRLRLGAIQPEDANAAPLIGCLSQWVGVTGDVVDSVRELLLLFPQAVRSRLPLNAYLHLRMADGVLHFANRQTAAAAAHFDFIISVEREPIDQELPALAHFWKALCERDRAEWDTALAHAGHARAISMGIGYPAAAAMMQALEGCLQVQKGRFGRAAELLREAEAVLQQTTDSTWRGNIQSAYGAVALEEGRYESAREHFAAAVSCYRLYNPRHGNLPETLVSLAHAERLMAVRTEKAIDLHAERRRRSAQSDSAASADRCTRQNVEQLRREASANLTDGIQLCHFLVESRGVALGKIELGFLFSDCGQFDRAALEATEAFELGCKINDYAVMASARLLNSKIENSQYEEGIGDAPAKHAQRAHDFAKEAITYAAQTGDRRLLASAHIAQGLIFCSDFFNNTEAASECCLQASQFLTAGNRTQLWDEHQSLARKVARKGSVDARLREWSQGLVQGKTFQQMTEEFAELVIPSVWEREGRNVSRVVAKLSISPKKVRRILARAGFKTGTD